MARKIKYLDYFDTVEYDFSGKGDFNTVVDITKNIIIKDKSSSVRYLKYIIKDGERPDTVSFKLYNDPKYYWLFFLYNDSLREGIAGWPLSNRQFDNMIEIEYDNYSYICPEPMPTISNSERHPSNYFFQKLPLNEKYFNDINIYVKKTDVEEYQLSDLKIKNIDSNRFGIILQKGENNFITDLGIGNKTVDFAYEAEALSTIYLEAADTELGAEWLASVEEEFYPTETIDGKTLIPLYYNIRLSQEFLKNAPYQYFEDIGEVQKLKGHYDVITNAIYNEEISFPQEITFIEYEKVLNERKKEITIPKKEALTELEYQYRSLLT
jgi:hypothetical protein